MLERRTSAIGSGCSHRWLFPTPTCNPDAPNHGSNSKGPHNLKEVALNGWSPGQMWPTPTVCGNHNRKGASATSGDGLATAVLKCATPTARDWRSGKAVPTRITLANAQPMGVAGLWAQWRSPQGETVHSFTMLTIHAGAHPLMRNFHKPQDEKRMIVILPPARYDDWLKAPASESGDFLQAWPALDLQATAPPNTMQPSLTLF